MGAKRDAKAAAEEGLGTKIAWHRHQALQASGRRLTVESAAVNVPRSQMLDRSTSDSQSGCFEAVWIDVP